MRDREPTVRSRELGDALRNVMAGAGYKPIDIARALDWSDGRVSRLLSGKRGGSQLDVMAVLAVCRVTGTVRDRLMRLSAEVDKLGWLQEFGAHLPEQVRTLIDYENRAVAIEQFEWTIVPGLLQTGDYARASMQRSANLPEKEIDGRVAARMARQALLDRRWPVPPQLSFFLHEFVLWSHFGGIEVMSDQLHHLLTMAVRPNISLRLIPMAAGAHAGVAGPFTLLDVAAFKSVAYLDSENTCLFLERPEQIEAYRNILNALRDTALDEGQSREKIVATAVELYSNGDDADDVG